MNETTKRTAVRAYRAHSESLPDQLGIELDAIGDKTLSTYLEVRNHHLNPAHTSCHAATMVALAAESTELVDKLHAKAIELGGADEGAPGSRGDSGFYAGYFRDLDGNKLNAFCMVEQ